MLLSSFRALCARSINGLARPVDLGKSRIRVNPWTDVISIASIVEEKDSQVIVGLGLFIRKQDRETGIGIGKGPRN